MKPYTEEELQQKTFKVQFRHSDVGPWFECEVHTQFVSNGLVDHIREQKKLNKFWPCANPPTTARIVKCEQPFDVAEFVHPYASNRAKAKGKSV